MQRFEYRAVPAPRKGKSGRGARGGASKLANALSSLMNDMAAEGWEYQRADTLPSEERQGLTSKTVRYHSILVFRRPIADVTAQIGAAEAAARVAAPEPEAAPVPEPPEHPEDPPLTRRDRRAPEATRSADSAPEARRPEESVAEDATPDEQLPQDPLQRAVEGMADRTAEQAQDQVSSIFKTRA